METATAAPRTRRVCPAEAANRLFVLCAMTYIVGLFGRMSYAAVMAELIAGEGFTKAQAGMIGTALFVVYGMCQFFSGILGDRIAPKKMVFAGVLGSGALNFAMGLSGSYGVMLALWALNGAFQALIWSPVFRVFSEVLPPTHRKRACANAAATYPLATVITYLFAALMLHTLGWRSVFLASAALMMAAAVFWWARMGWYERMIAARGDVEEITLTARETAASGSLLRLLVVSGVIFGVVGAVTHGMLRDGIQSWVPTFMTENFHFGTSLSVALAILLPIVNIAGVFLTKTIGARWIRNELKGSAAFFSVTIAALAALYFWSDTSAAGSLLMMTVASTCMVGSNIMLINLMPIHFGPLGRTSSVTGVLNCAAYLGSAVSAYGIGKAADLYGWKAAVLIWLVFSVFALVTALLGARKWGRYRRNI